MARRRTPEGGVGSNQYQIRGQSKQKRITPDLTTSKARAGKIPLDQLAHTLSIQDSERLLTDLACTPEILSALSQHRWEEIRVGVARHPNTDTDTLTRLARDRQPDVVESVAANPKCPPEILAKWVTADPESGLAFAALRNPNCPPHLRAIIAIANSDDW